MGKFSQLAKGTRSRKRIPLPLPGASLVFQGNLKDAEAAAYSWEGPTVPVDLRVLREDEHVEVLRLARAFSIERGVAEPEDGDPIYERWKKIHTLAIACLDADSPVDKPEPFFDGGWEQITTSEALTPEAIDYLFFQQQFHQDESSPLKQGLTTDEFVAMAIRAAGGDISFFVGSRPGVLWSCFRTLASQHVSSRMLSSPSTPASASRTPTKKSSKRK